MYILMLCWPKDTEGFALEPNCMQFATGRSSVWLDGLELCMRAEAM